MNLQSSNNSTDRLMRLPEVVEIVRRSRTSIYYDVKAGRFPGPLRIGARAIAWRERDIQKWIETRENGGAQ